MMNLPSLESHGRTILVQFKCYRCGTVEAKPLSKSLDTEGFRDLYDLIPPTGWRNGGFYYPLFCPECSKKYDLFMSGKELQQNE